MQAAAEGASGAMQGGIQSTTQAVSQNVSATQSVNSAITSANSSIVNQLQTSTDDIVEAVDASTKAITASITNTIKGDEQISDAMLGGFKTLLTEVVKAQKQLDNERLWGEQALTASGTIGANRSEVFNEGLIKYGQIRSKMASDMHAWNNDTENTVKGAKGLQIMSVLSEGEAVWDPTPMLTKNVLSQDESLNAQRLIISVLNPAPDAPVHAGDDPKGELERRLNNIKIEAKHAVLAKYVADRMPLINVIADGEDWRIGYSTVKDVDGKTSKREIIHNEIYGRLQSEDWYYDIRSRTDAGVMREQVYLQAIRNQLLLEISENMEHQLLMGALERNE